MPLMPPAGAPFLAWSSDEAIEAWIARNTALKDAKMIEDWRRTLRAIRSRGFQLTLRAADLNEMAVLLNQMSSGAQAVKFKDRVTGLMSMADREVPLPEEIELDRLYDVALIASPIFDETGAATYNLCIGDIPGKTSGHVVMDYAHRLMRACTEVMTEHRRQT
jgi:hypothetical protein